MLVLLGGLVTSVVPASGPLDDLPVVAALRATTTGRMVGLAVVVAGLGLLAWAWLVLLRVCADRSEATGDRLVLARRAAVLWSAPLLVAPPLFSRDGWSYVAQGELARIGASPYSWGPGLLDGPLAEAVDERWLWTAAPYGPLPLAWGSWWAELLRDPEALVVAHRLLAVLGLVLLAWAVPRLARWSGHDPAVASAVVLAGPFTVAHGVGGLHNDVAMVGLMAAALVVAAQRGWVLGAVVAGLAAAVKLPGGLVCVAVVLLSLPALAGVRDRVLRTVAVASVAVATLLAAGVATGLGSGWVGALGVPGEVRTPLSAVTMAGVAVSGVLDLLGLDDASGAAVAVARGAGTVAVLALGAVLLLRGRTADPAAALRVAAVLTGAAVVLSPVVHHWYAFWALPFGAALPLGLRAAAALRAAVVLLALTAPLDSSLEGAWVPIVLTTALVVGVALALLLTDRAAGRLRPAVDARPRAPERA